MIKEEWLKDDKLHRENDFPALIRYNYWNKRVKKESLFKDGKLHREGDFPAVIYYSWIGNEVKILGTIWFKNNEIHRERDLPAVIYYFENGNKKEEHWNLNTKYYYRLNRNPCVITYHENGKIKSNFHRSLKDACTAIEETSCSIL